MAPFREVAKRLDQVVKQYLQAVKMVHLVAASPIARVKQEEHLKAVMEAVFMKAALVTRVDQAAADPGMVEVGQAEAEDPDMVAPLAAAQLVATKVADLAPVVHLVAYQAAFPQLLEATAALKDLLVLAFPLAELNPSHHKVEPDQEPPHAHLEVNTKANCSGPMEKHFLDLQQFPAPLGATQYRQQDPEPHNPYPVLLVTLNQPKLANPVKIQ